jgi:hypothetical protein
MVHGGQDVVAAVVITRRPVRRRPFLDALPYQTVRSYFDDLTPGGGRLSPSCSAFVMLIAVLVQK